MDRIAFTVADFVRMISEQPFHMETVHTIANLICIVSLLFVQGALEGLPLFDLHVSNIAVTDDTMARAVIIDWNGNEKQSGRTPYPTLKRGADTFLKWFTGQHTWNPEADEGYLKCLSMESQSNVQTWRNYLAEVARLTKEWQRRHQARRLLRLGSRLPHPLSSMATNFFGPHQRCARP